MIKQAQLTDSVNNHPGSWDLSTIGSFGTTNAWRVVIGNIQANDLSTATSQAQVSLSQINNVNGPFLSEHHWACKHAPEPRDCYIIAWNLNPTQPGYSTSFLLH